MNVNGKSYAYDIRTEEDNKKFLDLLETAEDKLQQARSCIAYSLFPDLNRSTINKIENIIGDISQVEYNVSCGHTNLFKPVKKDDEVCTKYYEVRVANAHSHGRFCTKLDKSTDGMAEQQIIELLCNKTHLAQPHEVTSIKEISEVDYREFNRGWG